MKMLFEREATRQLLQWKSKKNKKPLLVMGARQVGKTTLIKNFGEVHFESLAYFNFERSPELYSIFQQTKDPTRILDLLSLIFGRQITAENTLLFFDEIQECSDAVTALKYFYEEVPKYSVIAAGSLLGITIGKDLSFPVGKVEFLDLYPLSFTEYLKGTDKKLYEAFTYFLNSGDILPIPQIHFTSLQEKFNTYLMSGGMPEVAVEWVLTKSLEAMQKIQQQILRSYQLDFSKHANGALVTRILHVWNSIPSQLAKENKKFIYKVVRHGARAREYEAAVIWLEQARIILKIHAITKPEIPLRAFKELSIFKIYFMDVGLLMLLSGMTSNNPIHWMQQFKGDFTENYVAQSLSKSLNSDLFYWTSDGRAEVDFVISLDSKIALPIEVKSGVNLKSKSLSTYSKKYHPKLCLRISQQNFDYNKGILNVPVFYTDHLTELVRKII